MNPLSQKFCFSILVLLVALGLTSNTLSFGQDQTRPKKEYRIRTINNVVYGTGNLEGGKSKKLLLDISLPKAGQVKDPLPVVVLIHGGGFKSGSRKSLWYRNLRVAFAKQGYFVASIDYRLLGDKPKPNKKYLGLLKLYAPGVMTRNVDRLPPKAKTIMAATEDTVNAVNWIKKNAKKYSVDESKIALLGASAGSHLALQVGYSLDDARLEGPKIAAVIDICGSMPIRKRARKDLIQKGDPPLLILHGTNDERVSFQKGVAIFELAKKATIPVEFYPVTGASHNFNRATFEQVIDPKGKTSLEKMSRFLDKCFRDPKKLKPSLKQELVVKKRR